MFSSSNSSNESPSKDPYDVLGVPFNSTDSEIKKAYRRLALKFHPDKKPQQQSLSVKEVEEKFYDIKEAKSFLLDVENSDSRRKYDSKRESERLRRQTDAIREKNMSERRKRLREELKQKEELVARESSFSATATATTSGKKQKREKNKKSDVIFVEKLRNEGKKKRMEYAERDAKKKDTSNINDTFVQRDKFDNEYTKRKRDRTNKQNKIEDQQVRLKWDRRKMKPSPSEHSLAKLLSTKFGPVISVQILDTKKGNQALVTFKERSSCSPCVTYYWDNVIMRAKYVGKRKDKEEKGETEKADEKLRQRILTFINKHTNESIEARKMRQAVERDRVIRKMEEEENVTSDEKGFYIKPGFGEKLNNRTKNHIVSIFPLTLSSADNSEVSITAELKSIDLLENFELTVLGKKLTNFTVLTIDN